MIIFYFVNILLLFFIIKLLIKSITRNNTFIHTIFIYVCLIGYFNSFLFFPNQSLRVLIVNSNKNQYISMLDNPEKIKEGYWEHLLIFHIASRYLSFDPYDNYNSFLTDASVSKMDESLLCFHL